MLTMFADYNGNQFNDMSTVILAIESSCDDTSASVLMDGEILSNCVANQDA
ncbi:MAG: hypothetical protein HRU12_25055, partial [Phaeodactylibacter sp.]|nr:hypothetical protein [Phaeodactylibacter sp.]